MKYNMYKYKLHRKTYKFNIKIRNIIMGFEKLNYKL